MSSLLDLPDEQQKTRINTQDDATLVALVIQNGPEAFGAIVTRYQNAVFGVALSRLRNFHDAEDLTQTTFVEAFNRLDRLKDATNLGPWLRTIAINRCINFLKRRNRIVDFETIEEPVSETPSPQAELEKAELRREVLDAIGRLSKAQRETVTLYYIGEYTLAEVAAIQEVPLGTVKRRLHEARIQLKKDMFEMVEEVLKNNAPDEALANRVFQLLCSYPTS
ncbi:MAG: RNA polymerase sigma factor [bacterium]|nr:RNA polymerase sigma factor [bacterium]